MNRKPWLKRRSRSWSRSNDKLQTEVYELKKAKEEFEKKEQEVAAQREREKLQLQEIKAKVEKQE